MIALQRTFYGILLCFCLWLTGCQRQDNNLQQGYIEAELTYLASPISGTLERLTVQRGDTVTQGQPLFALDQQPQAASYQQAQANLQHAQETLSDLEAGQRATILEAIQAQITQAKAQAELTKLQLNRYQQLYAQHAIDKNTLDEIVASHQQATGLLKQYQANLAENKLGSRQQLIAAQKALVASADAQLKQAQWEVQQKTLSAPANAIVFDTYYQSAEFVPQGSPVLSLLLPDSVRVIFYVPEPLLAKIKIGQVVTLHCDNCTATYQAKIDYISPSAEYTPPLIYSEQNNSKLVFAVKAALMGNAVQNLHPGQPVSVDIASNNE